MKIYFGNIQDITNVSKRLSPADRNGVMRLVLDSRRKIPNFKSKPDSQWLSGILSLLNQKTGSNSHN